MRDILPLVEQDIVCGDDGVFIWWPEGYSKGGFNSESLSIITQELKKRNKEWTDKIEDYFSK